MVELKLEALDFDNSANDTYVAVRVGENQKLSRLASVRNFKFPKSIVGDRKYGKVDVFKRVGTGSVSIRSDSGNAVQELQVACNTGTNMNFRVTLGGEVAPGEKPPPKEAVPAVLEAKSYLLEHNLEMVLAEAMQAVLRERPADPTQFIATKLMKSVGTYRRVPTEGRAQTAPAPGRVQTAPTPAPVETFEPPLAVEDFNTNANTPLAMASQQLYGMFPQTETKAATVPDVEQLRQAARQTLMDATNSGQLETALAKKSRAEILAGPNVEQLRQEAKQTLMDATLSGQLDTALAGMQKKSGAEILAGPNVEQLRQEAKQTLMDATFSGQLDTALAGLKKTGAESAAAPDVEQLRQEAKRTLMEATNSGQLDKALAVMKKPEGEAAAAPNVEQLRQEAKQILVDATSSGKLDSALASFKNASGAAIDADLGQQVKQCLVEAASSGALDKALADVLAPKAKATEADALLGAMEAKAALAALLGAVEAKDILRQAATSGALAEALAGLPKKAS